MDTNIGKQVGNTYKLFKFCYEAYTSIIICLIQSMGLQMTSNYMDRMDYNTVHNTEFFVNSL